VGCNALFDARGWPASDSLYAAAAVVSLERPPEIQARTAGFESLIVVVRTGAMTSSTTTRSVGSELPLIVMARTDYGR
jgi:hypothetical protein